MQSTRFKKLLVCLDTSPRAPAVLAAAIELAKEFGARLVLFRAVGLPVDLPAEAFSHPASDLPGILEAKARIALEALAREVPEELFPKARVRIGTPWDAICRTAHDEGVDLIVIGSHGFSGVDRLIGTTAGRVVNHAHQSVLVVRNNPKP